MPTITIPGDPNATPPRDDITNVLSIDQLTTEQLLYLEADELAKQYILLGLPNPILHSVDAQKTAKAMREHIHLLMEGTELNQEDMESKIYLAYENFMIEPGESLESYYHRFLDIINDLDKHNIIMPRIAINTKFLSCLGPDWEKYVTFIHQSKNLHQATYGFLYDYLKHHQKEVDKDRIIRGVPASPSLPDNQTLSLYTQACYPQFPTLPTAFTNPP